ncbi:MAG: T9SS type A sorting domain-containing protein, partial [Bacteroidetes bacterium]|nr:T9SS type A sorting domain-containing protein [Bacteroidota bacterium]
PNPSEGIFYLSLESQLTQKLEIEVVDLTGRIFFQKQIQASGSSIVELIDLSLAPAGFYMIGVKGKTGIYYEKVVKN